MFHGACAEVQQPTTAVESLRGRRADEAVKHRQDERGKARWPPIQEPAGVGPL